MLEIGPKRVPLGVFPLKLRGALVEVIKIFTQIYLKSRSPSWMPQGSLINPNKCIMILKNTIVERPSEVYGMILRRNYFAQGIVMERKEKG